MSKNYEQIQIISPNVQYSDKYIEVDYQYATSHVQKRENNINVSLE